MSKILINNYWIILNTFEIQTGSKGRPFKQAGLRKNLQQPSKWIDKVEKWCWVYTFNYQDKQGGSFEIGIDCNDKYMRL